MALMINLNSKIINPAPAVSPYMLGVLDAERGQLCVPEMYFVRRGDCCAYCEGYQAVAGATLTTRQFLGTSPQAKFNAMCAAMIGDDVDYDAEADDYAEYMADVEWMRTGC